MWKGARGILRKLFSGILALLALLCCCGCSGDNPSEENEPFPVTVLGVTFNEPVESAVILSPSAAEMAVSFGLSSKVAAVSEECAQIEELAQLKTVGSEEKPDISAIIELSPDVVITRRSFSKSTLEQFNNAGIKALVIPNATDMRELKSYYTAFATVFLGSEDASIQNKTLMEDAFFKISALQNVLNETKTSFLHLNSPSSLAQKGNFLSSLLSYIGSDVTASGEMDLNTAVQQNPTNVLIASPYTVENLAADPSMSALQAVIEKRVYTLDISLFDRQSLSSVDAVYELAKQMYPEQADALDAFVEEQKESNMSESESSAEESTVS